MYLITYVRTITLGHFQPQPPNPSPSIKSHPQMPDTAAPSSHTLTQQHSIIGRRNRKAKRLASLRFRRHDAKRVILPPYQHQYRAREIFEIVKHFHEARSGSSSSRRRGCPTREVGDFVGGAAGECGQSRLLCVLAAAVVDDDEAGV